MDEGTVLDQNKIQVIALIYYTTMMASDVSVYELLENIEIKIREINCGKIISYIGNMRTTETKA